MNHRDSYIVSKTMADIEFKFMDHSVTEKEKYRNFREIMERACMSHGKENIGK